MAHTVAQHHSVAADVYGALRGELYAMMALPARLRHDDVNMDTLPWLREMCRAEAFREAANTKRRYGYRNRPLATARLVLFC